MMDQKREVIKQFDDEFNSLELAEKKERRRYREAIKYYKIELKKKTEVVFKLWLE